MSVLTELGLFGPSGYRFDPQTWDPVGVRGIDKVAQRFVYALLTPLGSVPGRPSDGSPFVDMVSGFRSEFDVFAAFLTAESAAAQSVQAAESADEPDSEKYGAARLSKVVISDGELALTIVVASADGAGLSQPVEFTFSL